ncbi:MAG: hypothetical protein QM770_12460 [Tepidisphaeraceae bacterium]
MREVNRAVDHGDDDALPFADRPGVVGRHVRAGRAALQAAVIQVPLLIGAWVICEDGRAEALVEFDTAYADDAPHGIECER